MNNKLTNIMFAISIILLIPTAIWGLLYEYLIFDKSIIPNNIYNLTLAIGYSSLFGLIISIVLDKIIDRIKEKKRTNINKIKSF